MLRVVPFFLRPQTKAPKKEGMAARGMASSFLCSCGSTLSKLVGSRTTPIYEARKCRLGQSCGQGIEQSNARADYATTIGRCKRETARCCGLGRRRSSSVQLFGADT